HCGHDDSERACAARGPVERRARVRFGAVGRAGTDADRPAGGDRRRAVPGPQPVVPGPAQLPPQARRANQRAELRRGGDRCAPDRAVARRVPDVRARDPEAAGRAQRGADSRSPGGECGFQGRRRGDDRAEGCRAAAARAAGSVGPLGPRTLDAVPRHRLCLLAVALAVSGCGGPFPQSTLEPRSDFGWAVDHLFTDIFWWAAGVFLVVEALLVITLIRFRHREGRPAPRPTHGHTVMEIAWTLAPAVILVFVAGPTVRVIVDSDSGFGRWATVQLAGPAAPAPGTLAERGESVYARSACLGCHTIQGVSPGIIGPNLTHVGSRTTIASGLFPNDSAHLASW